MSEKVLRIFELCKELASLLGDKRAVADLEKLYAKHSKDNMFKDMEEVANMINEVAKKPEIITKAKTPNAILAAKKLKEPNRMGDIVVVNNDGTNVIIHANKKRLSAFDKLKTSLVETPTPSTHRDLPTEELTTHNNELSGANARSAKQAFCKNKMNSLVETPAPSTHRQKPTEELTTHNNELSGANAHSANPSDNSTTELSQTQSKPKIRRNK